MEPEEKADISTLEKTGHLYFGPTSAGKLEEPAGFPASWRGLSKLCGPNGGFEGISRAVKSVGTVAAEIHSALRQQSEAVLEVAELMKDVNRRVRENEASTERMSGSVRSLMDEAANPHENVQRFKL
jgi:hypothetical protein